LGTPVIAIDAFLLGFGLGLGFAAIAG